MVLVGGAFGKTLAMAAVREKLIVQSGARQRFLRKSNYNLARRTIIMLRTIEGGQPTRF